MADDLHTHPLAFCLGTSRGTLWARCTGPALSEKNRSGGCKPVRVGAGVERYLPGDRGDLEVQLVLAVPKRGDPSESCAVTQLGPTDLVCCLPLQDFLPVLQAPLSGPRKRHVSRG